MYEDKQFIVRLLIIKNAALAMKQMLNSTHVPNRETLDKEARFCTCHMTQMRDV